ncbi:MAG: lipocalin-like domain-containing protein [Muribaculaceae bacterium]|nr:lipocalin-like domain-containing protein [Muribaculaceae bacterium]
MKNKTARGFLLPLIALVVLTLGGCTHNNGDIGPLFGNWKLVSVTGDTEGHEVPQGCSVDWNFQNSTIHMSMTLSGHRMDNRFGNYRLDDNTLFLDFPDTDTQYGEPLLGLPAQCELQVLRLDGHRLQLLYVPTPESQGTTFTFRKF